MQLILKDMIINYPDDYVENILREQYNKFWNDWGCIFHKKSQVHVICFYSC